MDLPGSLCGRSAREVKVVDLSLTGCLVQGDAPLDRGVILDLTVNLGKGPLATKVRVSESCVDGTAPADSPPRYLTGLEFLALGAHGGAQLRRFLEEERRRRVADTPAH
jgi:hypothetical protein